jgi:hypothetical protein
MGAAEQADARYTAMQELLEEIDDEVEGGIFGCKPN